MDIFETDKKLSCITIKNHKKNIRLIKEKTGLEFNDFEKRNPNEILQILQVHFKNAGYYKNVVTSVCKYLNLKNIVRDVYLKELKMLSDNYLKLREKNVKNEKEEKNWVDYEELKDYCIQLLSESVNQDALMIASYILMPPVRNDWCSVKIKNYDKEKDNFIILNENKLILNHYKTSKKYGKIDFLLPKTYLTYLNTYLTSIDNDQEFLFTTKTNKEQFKKNNFSKKLVRLFKKRFPNKNINIQLLRKIFSSQVEKQSLESVRKISQVMGHSLVEHLRYSKMSLNNNNNNKTKDIDGLIFLLNKYLPKENILNYIYFDSHLTKWKNSPLLLHDQSSP
jgi:hypothetical protein